jgi:ABC-type multidrug transport system fused ATPase/permease subunit
MPKNYAMGGRTTSPKPGDASLAPERPSWRARLGALRNLPPFLKLVWRTSPALTLSQSLLRVVRALLPVATLYVGKLIIDEVVLLAQVPPAGDNLPQWIASGLLDRIGWLLALEFGLAILSDILGRTVSLLDSLLSEKFSNETSLRLMQHAATLDLEDFEDSELQDRLERARRQAGGRSSLIGQLYRPGTGCGHRRELCRRAARVRALAHRAPRDCSRAGIHRRGALQRTELFAQLCPHVRAPRARLRSADGRQHRNGQGSKDLRAQRFPDRNLFEMRANIGVIFQDFVRCHFSAADNIAVGRIEARDDRARIVAAAERSLADEVVRKLPDGYDQIIGKRFRTGIDLSGGEWQKIAIARAYMRDAQLLILDEPTAALDARSEFEVFKRFKELSKGKTAVLISHRFSSVRMADRIVVLMDGAVEAVGTHAELLERGGRYAELFELQAAGYR